MCGIAGILRISPAVVPAADAVPAHWLAALDDSIAHRGRDGRGVFKDRAETASGGVADVALISRRLSIIDHGGGAQPMLWPSRWTTDGAPAGALALVHNGCIYNHRELRRDLTDAGHAFSSDHSDTEVILAAWRIWRERAFGHLVGMTACAIWARDERRLVLFRSAPGEKPLYIARGPDAVAFASTPRALHRLRTALAWPAVEPARRLVPAWLAFGHHHRMTPFPGVEQLPFGSVVSIRVTDDGLTERHATVDPRRSVRADILAHRDNPVRLRDGLDGMIGSAVRGRLDADVPLGCLLSGGVDSSLVAAHAAAAIREARPGAMLTTICVRMPSPRYDESLFAQAVASNIGSRHRTVDVSPHAAEDLVHLIETLGLPFGDSSLLPTYWACRAAREEFGVALSGDGGDELFYGYTRYIAAGFVRTLAPIAALLPASLFNDADQRSRRAKATRFIAAARAGDPASLLAVFQRGDLAGVIGDDAVLAYEPIAEGVSLRDEELCTNLQSDMLRKVDHASMLAGVEVRAPLLDQSLFHTTARLSARELAPGFARKALLRGIARRYLPTAIIDRPKMGFAIPLGAWFRSNWGGMRDLLHDALTGTDPFPVHVLGVEVNGAAVRSMMAEHENGRRDHGQRLYALLVLAIWARQSRVC